MSNLCVSCVRSNVWKKYGNKEAVKGLNLALKANECFGLLGSNGAGKTTTFKMLTGDIKNTAGDIYVCGVNVNNNREKVSGFFFFFVYDALRIILRSWVVYLRRF